MVYCFGYKMKSARKLRLSLLRAFSKAKCLLIAHAQTSPVTQERIDMVRRIARRCGGSRGLSVGAGACSGREPYTVTVIKLDRPREKCSLSLFFLLSTLVIPRPFQWTISSVSVLPHNNVQVPRQVRERAKVETEYLYSFLKFTLARLQVYVVCSCSVTTRMQTHIEYIEAGKLKSDPWFPKHDPCGVQVNKLCAFARLNMHMRETETRAQTAGRDDSERKVKRSTKMRKRWDKDKEDRHQVGGGVSEWLCFAMNYLRKNCLNPDPKLQEDWYLILKHCNANRSCKVPQEYPTP